MTSRVNSRLTHCQHNPRGSLLENLVLRCQAALHNSPAGLLPVMSRAQCGCAAAERPSLQLPPVATQADAAPIRPEPDSNLLIGTGSDP